MKHLSLESEPSFPTWLLAFQESNVTNPLQTSALVKHFHSCVLAGEEYEENDWDSLIELPPHSSRKKAGGTPASKTE